MFELFTKIFIGILTGLVNRSNHTKCVLLSNQKCIIQPTLVNVHSNEYSQEVHYYTSSVKLDRCVGTCNNLKGLSNKVCISHKTDDLDLNIFNMISDINESKILTKHISYDGKSNLIEQNVIQISGGKTIIVDVSVTNIIYVKKNMFLHVFVKMENI